MTVHVGEVTTEVVPTPPPEAGDSAEPEAPWTAAERQRRLLERLARDRARTAADGYDD